MIRKKSFLILAIITTLFFALPLSVMAEDSPALTAFLEAFDLNDREKMYTIVEENLNTIPGEITKLTYKAMSPGMDKEKKEATLYTAELLAMNYKDITGDVEPLRQVKRQQFEMKLSKTVVSTPNSEGVHIINMPMSSEEKHNYFEPDNITVKAGDTVRWVNNDKIAHLFASFSIIGKGGLFTPSIPVGETWEYTFAEAGEYYYLCFIHKGMIGKVNVKE